MLTAAFSPQFSRNGGVQDSARSFEALLGGANRVRPQIKLTIPEEKDKQAWLEIERQRSLGLSYRDIWFNSVDAGNREIVGALIRQPPSGFDLNQTDSLGRTALHRAAFSANGEDIARLLVNEGRIDIAVLDGSERSAYKIVADLAGAAGSDPKLQRIADFLKSQLNKEAGAAFDIGDTKRLDALVAAGADDPRSGRAPSSGSAPPPKAGPLDPKAVRPDGDRRTAQEIIAANPVLANLSAKDKEFLKHGYTDKYARDTFGKDFKVGFRGVGDFENDADAAYRAAAVLNHIENFNENGDAISPSGAGAIDGWTREDRNDKKSEAVHGTESGRFQDFLKYGYASLKGDSLPDGLPPELGPPPAPPQSVIGNLPNEFKRPDSDKRTAEEIRNASPLLRNLSENDKKALQGRVGDFENDADAAYRAVAVIDHIERYDEQGKAIRGSKDIGNGTIDGWTRADRNDPKSEARHGTEAGRFQDFIKYGWDTLRKAVDPVQTTNINQLVDLAKASGNDYAKFKELVTRLKEDAYYSIIGNAGLPSDKSDVIAHPERYSTEQRGAAVLELTIMMNRIEGGIGNYTKEGVAYGSNYFGGGNFLLNTDPAKLLSGIRTAIDKISNDDVGAWISKAEATTLQTIVNSNPDLKNAIRDRMNALRDRAEGLDAALDGGGDLIDNMRSYLALAATLNTAAGENGKDYIENLTIDIRGGRHFEAITREYEKKLGDPQVLSELVRGGMREEEAIAEINARAATFAAFGSPPGDISASVNANIQQHYLNNTNGSELVGIILDKDGNIDEGRLGQIIDEIRRSDPDSAYLRSDTGESLTNAQIITGVRAGWDTFRASGKWNHSLSKFGPGFMSDTSPIKQVYGYGGMHFVSGLLAAGAMIAKGASGDRSPTAIASAVGSGMQVIGISGETFALQSRTPDNAKRIEALRERWNNSKYALDPNKNPSPEIVDGRRDWRVSPEAVKSKVGHLTNFSRLLSASGGSVVLGTSIAAGIEELKKGNPAGAAVYFSGGVANFATAPTAYAQSLLPYLAKGMDAAQLNRLIGRVALIGGRLGTAANPIAFLAMLGYTLYADIKAEAEQHRYFEGFTPTLADYGINGGHDPWWDRSEEGTAAS